jgi:ABC-type xylose transport system substrate-binding protein
VSICFGASTTVYPDSLQAYVSGDDAQESTVDSIDHGLQQLATIGHPVMLYFS